MLTRARVAPQLPYCIRQHTSACVSIRVHTSAYASIRQHARAGVARQSRPTASLHPTTSEC